MASDEERRVFEALDGLGIPYVCHEHPPVFTVEQAEEHWADIDATHCKNLFLRNKKGDAHYLVIIEHRKSPDIRRLTAQLGQDRLSFASPERLQKYLGLTAGAVSPFGLIHDSDHVVRVVIDADLRRSARIAFHPNVNTATISLSFADFQRFLAARGNIVRYVMVGEDK